MKTTKTIKTNKCFRIKKCKKQNRKNMKNKTKLIVFDYIISKLVEWKCKTKGQTKKEVLENLSFIPLMKCHYSICLLSVSMQDKKSLFDLFDNFRAYPRGPVEEDCYLYMNELPNYKIETDDHGKTTLVQKQVKMVEQPNNTYIKMVNSAIDELKTSPNFPEFSDKDKFSELCNMSLWKNAYETHDGKCIMQTKNNFENVRMEARSFRNLFDLC